MNKYKKEIVEKNLQTIAEREGLSVDEVYDEIALAISLAIKDPNPKVQEFWKSVPSEGEAPTIEETIAFLAAKMAKERK